MCPTGLQSLVPAPIWPPPSLGVAQPTGPLGSTLHEAWLVMPGRPLPSSAPPGAPLGPTLAESPGSSRPARPSFQKEPEGCPAFAWLPYPPASPAGLLPHWCWGSPVPFSLPTLATAGPTSWSAPLSSQPLAHLLKPAWSPLAKTFTGWEPRRCLPKEKPGLGGGRLGE